VTQLYDAHFPVSRGYEKQVIINVRGKKLDVVREALKKELEDKYYNKATLELTLYGTTSEGFGAVGPKVVIFGELSQQIPIREGQKLTCSEAILMAGGGGSKAEWADLRRVKIHRKNAESGKGETLTVDVDAVLKKNQPEKDVELRDGDRIEVLARRFRLGN